MTRTTLKGPDGIELQLDDSRPHFTPTVIGYDNLERLCISYYDDALEWGFLYGDDADWELELTDEQLEWLEKQRPLVDETTVLAKV